MVLSVSGRKSEMLDLNNGFVLQKKSHVNAVTAAIRQNIMTTYLIVLLLKQPRPVECRPLKLCCGNWGQ